MARQQTRVLRVALVALLSACAETRSERSADEISTSLCYRLTYSDSSKPPLAGYVALDLNAEREARSGVAPGVDDSYWQILLRDATWKRSGDTLEIQFTAGSTSGLEYQLIGPPEGPLRGRVHFQSHLVGEPLPVLPAVTASRIPCDQASIQSPRVTEAERAKKRLDVQRVRMEERENVRVRALASPLAGSYRFELRLPGWPDPVVLFARTTSNPQSAIWALTGFDQHSPAPDSVAPALGYLLPIEVTTDSATLGVRHRDGGSGTLAYFTVVEKPHRRLFFKTEWVGVTDVLFAASRVVNHPPALDTALAVATSAVDDVWHSTAAGETEGVWSQSRNGEVTFAMRVLRAGKLVLDVQGRRISATTLNPGDAR